MYRTVKSFLVLALSLHLAACDEAWAQRRKRGGGSGSRTAQGGVSGSQAPSRFSYLSTSFDGVATAAGEYANCGDPTTFDGATKISWSVWIRPDGTIATRDVFAKEVAGDLGFKFRQQATATFRVDIAASAGSSATATGPSNALTANAWNHVVIEYDGTQAVANDRLKVWVNTSAITLSYGGTMPTSMRANATNFLIGASNTGPPTFSSFKGWEDELAIWVGTILTTGNITELYNLGRPGNLNNITFTAPTSWYRMGEGDSYPTIRDLKVGGVGNCTMQSAEESDFSAVVAG